MGEFHSRDGLHFRREPNGDVVVSVRGVPLTPDYSATLDADTWASVVAHVSAPGESGATFRLAQSMHAGELV